MKDKTKLACAFALILTMSFFGVACDTPAENATEERVEDAQENKGVPESTAEQQGEAVKDGAATAGTYGTTDTTVTTGTTGTTATTVTTATTGS